MFFWDSENWVDRWYSCHTIWHRQDDHRKLLANEVSVSILLTCHTSSKLNDKCCKSEFRESQKKLNYFIQHLQLVYNSSQIIVSETVPQLSPAPQVSVDEQDQADVTCTPRQMDNNDFKHVKLLMPTTYTNTFSVIDNAENTISEINR